MLLMQNEFFMGASQWDTVNFNKNKVWNISIRLVAISFHHYLKFLKLAHDAFCKQTLQLYECNVCKCNYFQVRESDGRYRNAGGYSIHGDYIDDFRLWDTE